MRSAAGVFCPRSRRLDFLEVLFPRKADLVLDGLAFFGAAVCACDTLANTPSPAARSSAGARQIALRSRIVDSEYFSSVAWAAVIADYPRELCPTNIA